ncbi:MAG: hypothetical protein HWD92_10570 [Flavobacteriia bacterium]|nr:hypothetical protein [Flavobacteriia bacterium]
MKKQARLLLLTLPLLVLASCTPFKHAQTSVSEVSGNRTEYKIMLEKDAKDYLEIVDVRLINSENMTGENAQFRVVDFDGSTTLLNLTGYDKFYVLATIGNSDLSPDRAIVTYKTEPEGDNKTEVVKPLIPETEE